MALELKRPADQSRHHGTDVGTGVGHNEVLAARFPHYAGVAAVHLQVLTDGLPKVAEHACGPSEVQSREFAVFEDHISGHRTIACHHVDDAIWQASLLENLHDDLGAVDLSVGGLPHHHVAHQSCHGGEVSGNGGEVEGGDGEDKSFKRTVFQSVPNAVGGFRLLRVDLLGEVSVEAQEVGKLTSSVDFSLEAILALRQHRCGIDLGPVRTCNEVGCFQEHRSAVLPPQVCPRLAGLQRGINGLGHMGLGAVAEVPQHFAVFVGWRHGPFVVGRDACSAQVHRDLNGRLVVHGLVCRLKGFPLRCARCIAEHGFVDGVGYVESSVGHCE